MNKTTLGSVHVTRRKYLITSHLLCLPIIGTLDGYYVNMHHHDDGLEFLMSNELKVGENEHEEFKLQWKKKARSKADAKYGHAVIYVDYLEKPPKQDFYHDGVNYYNKTFAYHMTEFPYLQKYFDEHNAFHTRRIEQKARYLKHVFFGRGFRAASKRELEDLYTSLLEQCSGVGDIVNVIFESLNIHHVLSKLSVGSMSKQIQRDRKKAYKKERKRKLKNLENDDDVKRPKIK